MAIFTLFLVCYLCFHISDGLVLDSDSSSQTRIDALEFMLVEEKQLRMKLETKLDDLVGRVTSMESTQDRCSCSNRTVTPKPTPRPAFMATLSSTMDHCQAKQAIIFDTVTANVGAAYSATHGVFTAPLSGYYAFYVTITVYNNHFFHIAMVKNNASDINGLYLFDDGFEHARIRSTSLMIHLNKHDEVWMICLGESQILGDYDSLHNQHDFHSHFSGFLVDAD